MVSTVDAEKKMTIAQHWEAVQREYAVNDFSGEAPRCLLMSFPDVPVRWLSQAGRLPGKAFQVAMALAVADAMRPDSLSVDHPDLAKPIVTLTDSLLAMFGCDPQEGKYGLELLEAAKMVRVKWRAGKPLQVRLDGFPGRGHDLRPLLRLIDALNRHIKTPGELTLSLFGDGSGDWSFAECEDEEECFSAVTNEAVAEALRGLKMRDE